MVKALDPVISRAPVLGNIISFFWLFRPFLVC